MTPTIIQVQEKGCEVFNITMEELLSTRRPDHIAKPRMLMMKWCQELGYRKSGIAKEFKRHPKDVYHACSSSHFNKLELERMDQVKAAFAVNKTSQLSELSQRKLNRWCSMLRNTE